MKILYTNMSIASTIFRRINYSTNLFHPNNDRIKEKSNHALQPTPNAVDFRWFCGLWHFISFHLVVPERRRSATGLGIDMVVYPVVYMGLVIHLPAQAILFFPHI